MPGTHTLILLHVIFATYRRGRWLAAPMRDRLYAFMGGICRDERASLLKAGGVEDHVHLYIRLRPVTPLSVLLQNVKARSTSWIHDEFPALRAFAWQEGHGAFSVSKSQEPALIRYIENQEQHHAKVDFNTELRALLAAHGVEFNERFVDV